MPHRSTGALTGLAILLLVTAGTSAGRTQEILRFEHVLSTGPFLLPDRGHSLDWVVLNSAADSQDVRVTVWQLNLSGVKTKADPGTLTFRVGPGEAFHNANSIGGNGPFRRGFYYEVVVEVNTRLVLPSVEVWSDDRGTPIPGTRIGPVGFVELRP